MFRLSYLSIRKKNPQYVIYTKYIENILRKIITYLTETKNDLRNILSAECQFIPSHFIKYASKQSQSAENCKQLEK